MSDADVDDDDPSEQTTGGGEPCWEGVSELSIGLTRDPMPTVVVLLDLENGRDGKLLSERDNGLIMGPEDVGTLSAPLLPPD